MRIHTPMKKRMILIGITGGIAAFKSIELIKLLLADNFDVRVILTKNARAIIKSEEVKKLTGRAPYTELFDESFDYKKILRQRSVEHIDLANDASLFVIVPATANVIAKLASGLADDYLTTTALAATCPIMICPAMNVSMWTNPNTKRNVKILQSQGIQFVGPDTGMLACGYIGAGRLMPINVIHMEILSALNRNTSLKGKKIIITSGGTIEPIDDIRFITNKSSGKMGAALAESCFLRGAQVLLLRSKNSVAPRYAVKEEFFDTADSLRNLLKKYVPAYDICFHAAAVSDFSVNQSQGKLSSNERVSLELEPRSKIVDDIKSYNPKIFLAAFKAEWGVTVKELIARAVHKMKLANTDLIIANEIGIAGQGMQSDNNEVYIIDAKGKSFHIPKSTKWVIAEGIMDYISGHLR